MYLSTTDFIQHKYAPGDQVANTFYAMFDKYIGELNVNNNSIIITADHGMQPKSKADGSPNAIYLQDILDKKFGEHSSKVILPITDPYVVHHGALGSFATIYLKDKSKINDAMEEIKKIKADLKRFNRLRFNAYKFAIEKNFIWRAKNLMSSI